MSTSPTGAILRALIRTPAAAGVKAYNLPNPTPNSHFIGVSAGMTIYNGMYLLVLIVCGIAVIVGAAMIAIGKFSHRSSVFEGGLWTLGCAIAGAILATSAGVIITWSTGIQVV